MKHTRYIFFTILYFIVISFINQMLTYNVILTNIKISSQSIFWSLALIYIVLIAYASSKEKTILDVTLSSYIDLIEKILIVLFVSLVFLIINDIMIMKELNVIVYLKFVVTLFFVSITVSLIYFLAISFYKYRILWIVGFAGTVVLAPLLVEAGMFVRDLRFKSILDFWNWIVPYQTIEQLRQFVFLEGWQGWDVLLGSTIYLIVYWFIVASICLYIRQFQVSWKLPKSLPR